MVLWCEITTVVILENPLVCRFYAISLFILKCVICMLFSSIVLLPFSFSEKTWSDIRQHSSVNKEEVKSGCAAKNDDTKSILIWMGVLLLIQPWIMWSWLNATLSWVEPDTPTFLTDLPLLSTYQHLMLPWLPICLALLTTFWIAIYCFCSNKPEDNREDPIKSKV